MPRRFKPASGGGGSSHSRQHSIINTSDHTSAATPGNLLMADANGLPVDSVVDPTTIWIRPVTFVDGEIVILNAGGDPVSSGIDLTEWYGQSTRNRTRGITFWKGGTVELLPGLLGRAILPQGALITGVKVCAGQADGSLTLDVRKGTRASWSTDAATIIDPLGVRPSITNGRGYEDLAMANWVTYEFDMFDIVEVWIDSISVFTELTVILQMETA